MKHPQELVLYVDDDWSNCVIFEQTFKHDYNVKTLRSPGEALTFMAANPVAVLLTDQRMPEMSGNELLKKVRTLYPDTVRIIVTAFADSQPILHAINHGLVARYIVKPWEVDELREVLTWALEAYVVGRSNSALQQRVMQTERLITLGNIAASTVHDLVQPLGYLKGNSQALAGLSSSAAALQRLLGRYGHELEEEDRASLEMLAESLPDMASDMLFGCHLLSALAANVTRFLEKKEGEQRADTASTEPIAILRYALSTCRGLAFSAKARLIYDGTEVLPRVRMGPTELAQVLINLLANASQAVERRGQGGTVTLQTRRVGERLAFIVEDDGPGISPEVLAKLGTPFFSTRTDGTGLGLAQVKRLLHDAGGDLELITEMGSGTKAIAHIPIDNLPTDNAN